MVRSMKGGKRFCTGAHRLVYRHFNGPIPDGLTINHKNGEKQDNRPENLEVVTYSENTKHAYRIGLMNEDGERNPAAKLSNDSIKLIREEYAKGGVSQEKIGEKYGVKFQTISKIVRGDRRKTQPGPTGDYVDRRNQPERERNHLGQFRS